VGLAGSPYPADVRPDELRDLRVRQANTRDLLALQEIIDLEEGRALSLEEVLARVIGFYKRFVPL
jgi:hypothetical protein